MWGLIIAFVMFVDGEPQRVVLISSDTFQTSYQCEVAADAYVENVLAVSAPDALDIHVHCGKRERA